MNLDGLNALRGASFLEQWTHVVSEDNIAKTRSIIKRGIDTLTDLGPSSSEFDRIHVLRSIVQALNDADDGFICTIEREDLCEFLSLVGKNSGINDSVVDEVLEGRNW